MNQGMQWDVFISHSDYAGGWVGRFVIDAKRFGLRVFVDRDSVDPGEDIADSLKNGLQNSYDLVFAITSQALASKWVAWELADRESLSQIDRDRLLIPVRIESVDLKELDPLVSRRKWVDQTNDATRYDEYWNLIAYLNRRRMKNPRLVVISSQHDAAAFESEKLKSIIRNKYPNSPIEVVFLQPSNSCRVGLIVEEEVSNFVKGATKTFNQHGLDVNGVQVCDPFISSAPEMSDTRSPGYSPQERATVSTRMTELEITLRRQERTFGADRIGDRLHGWRAIVGPRADLLERDAQAARDKLIAHRNDPSQPLPTARELAALEQALRLQRPAPWCRYDQLTPLPAEGNWLAGEWAAFQPRLLQLQGSVARLERVDDPDPRGWTGRSIWGTGFLVSPDLLLTAGHVVDQLSFNIGQLERGQAVADFRGYKGVGGTELRSVVAVAALDRDRDLALLRIEPVEVNEPSRPLLLPDTSPPRAEAPICVVGYPLDDPRNPPGLLSLLFGDGFAIKRAAIGELLSVSELRCAHDCSTLGGNSGSPVIELGTGRVCGVHVSGESLTRNEAVASNAAREFVNQTLHPRPRSRRRTRSNSVNRKSSAIETFRRELMRNDPEMSRELQTSLESRAMAESVEGESSEFQFETVVLRQGRPVLDIRQGATQIEIAEPESQIWKDRLASATEMLQRHIPGVGRIELANHPRGLEWLGTGWLLRDNVVVTNRHVAEIFGEADGGGFLFRPGLDGTPMRSNIDFLEEFGSDAALEFPLYRIMHIERGGGPDLAFLRIEPVAGQDLPAPVPLSSDAVRAGDQIAVIGYPARDPFFPEPDVMDRIFNHRYDKKRLAPGLVTELNSERLFHDCSTLGGNSGGEIVSLTSGRAVALHFAGTLFQKNHAVPIDIVAQRLDDVLRGRIERPGPERPRSGDGTSLQSTARVSGGRVVEATIPIKVRIEIGDVVGSATLVASPADAVQPRVVDLDADDDLIETTEARPEDYRDRGGYNAKFLGADSIVPLPTLVEHVDDLLAFELDGRTESELRYQHFSVMMSTSRRMCRFSACNIDGKRSRRTSRTGWQLDPRISKSAQIMKECYGNPPKFSRGHMTRREDPAWGDSADANLGNRDSMHVTNTVPQIQPFNAGIWLDLEDYALQNARQDDMRISVFTGPFLASDDPIRFDVKIPISFWKVIAFVHDETGELCATGYTMSQKSFIGEEEFIFGRHENNQRPIREIERRTGISFGPLADVDPLRDQPESMAQPLTHTNQIRFV